MSKRENFIAFFEKRYGPWETVGLIEDHMRNIAAATAEWNDKLAEDKALSFENCSVSSESEAIFGCPPSWSDETIAWRTGVSVGAVKVERAQRQRMASQGGMKIKIEIIGDDSADPDRLMKAIRDAIGYWGNAITETHTRVGAVETAVIEFKKSDG